MLAGEFLNSIVGGGGEDNIFNDRIYQHVLGVRERFEGLRHQWHPDHCRYENYSRPKQSDYYRFTQSHSICEQNAAAICSQEQAGCSLEVLTKRKQTCLSCNQSDGTDDVTVQCRAVPFRVRFDHGRCKLRKWPSDDVSGLHHTPKVIVGALSCLDPVYMDRRRRCQQAWVPQLEQAGFEVFFLMGVGDRVSYPTIVNEKKHGRIGTELHLPCPDDYQSLPQKTYWFCKWAIENRSFDYLFKCDDDTYIEPDRFLQVDIRRVDYLGHVWYPRAYASGGAGYFLSHRAASIVADGLTQVEGAEDLLVGELLHKNGIAPVHDNRFVPLGSEENRPLPDNDLITTHACEHAWAELSTNKSVNDGQRIDVAYQL